MEDRKGEIVSGVRVLAIVSSSVAAAECVSRSESLLRHVRIRCLNSRVEDWLFEYGFVGGIVEFVRFVYRVGGVSGFSGSIAGMYGGSGVVNGFVEALDLL
ncbi:hypothetical protein Hanom_Chr09g00838041 [Helianthus anomalus]